MKKSTSYSVSAGLWLVCFFLNLGTFMMTKGGAAFFYALLMILNIWLYRANKLQAEHFKREEDGSKDRS